MDQIYVPTAAEEINLSMMQLQIQEVVNNPQTQAPKEMKEEPKVGEEYLEDKTKEAEAGGYFHINNKRYLLTYPDHIPKDQLKQILLQAEFDLNADKPKKNMNQELTECHIAHETGDVTNPYPHTHVAISFSSTVQTRNCRIFDYPVLEMNGFKYITKAGIYVENMHPNIKVLGNAQQDWHRVCSYVAKEDPQLADVLLKYPLLQPKKNVYKKYVEESDSIQDALKKATRVSDAPGIIAMYRYKERPKLRCAQFRPYGWQLDVLDMLSWSIADSRKIYWNHEPEGSIGKTSLVKFLAASDPSKFWFLQGIPYLNDAATKVSNALKEGWTGHAILINLTRKFQELTYIYETLEALKDGLVSAIKYNGPNVIYDCPHIIVFANWVPNWTGKLSADRLVIRTIVPEPPPEGFEQPVFENKRISFGEDIDKRLSERKSKIEIVE